MDAKEYSHYFDLATAMRINGGSFAHHIGSAFLTADSSNQVRLVWFFADLFRSYEHWLIKPQDGE